MERFKRYAPLIRGLAPLIFLLALAFLLLGAHAISAILLVIKSGAAAFALEPLCAIYEKKLPRAMSALCALISGAAIAITCVLLLAPPLIDMLVRLSDAIVKLKPAADRLFQALEARGVSLSGVSGYVAALGATLANAIARAASSAAAIGVGAVVCFFILRDREKLLLRLEMLIPRRIRGAAVRAGRGAARELRMFLRGQLIIAACVAILTATGLTLARVPGGAGLGLMAGLLNIVPYLGPLLAVFPVTAAALTISVPRALIAFGVLITVQQIDGLIISPRVLGDATGISPAFIVLAIYVMGAVWGAGGVLAALPVLILIRTCFRVFVETAPGD